jgi:hypothetical protein
MTLRHYVSEITLVKFCTAVFCSVVFSLCRIDVCCLQLSNILCRGFHDSFSSQNVLDITHVKFCTCSSTVIFE